MENEEMMNDEQPKKSKFTLWLENYWYHYKLHTIAVLFAVMVISVVTFQLCSRPTYDIHIMYAGGKTLAHTKADDDTYTNIVTSLCRVSLDYDENGVIEPDLLALFLPSDSEIQKLKDEDALDLYAPLIKSDSDTLNSNLMLSEFYICFFSEELFLERDKNQRPSNDDPMYPFADLNPYIDQSKAGTYRFVDGSTRGIYLSSTDFYKMPGICELPEDTVITFRIRSTVYNSDSNIEYYESCEQVLKNILSYTTR